jgi:hypothetical protein
MTLSDRRKEKLITLVYDNEINAVPSYIKERKTYNSGV